MSATLILRSGAHGITLCRENGEGAVAWTCGLGDPGLPARVSALLAEDHLEHLDLMLCPAPEWIDEGIARVGVICVGLAGRPFERLDVAAKTAVPGLIDINGVEQTPLDESELSGALSPLLESGAIKGFVVSGVNSGRNPLHEQRIASRTRELTGLPVLAARFWGDSLSAGRRALAAAKGLATLLALVELQQHITELRRRLTVPVRVRASLRESALLSAMVDAPEFMSLAEWVDGRSNLGWMQARITRGAAGYVCHCTDGAFEFDSITLARQFADRHLRDQLAGIRAQFDQSTPAIEVQSNDRYTFVRGKRGPVRVFLETIVTARASR